MATNIYANCVSGQVVKEGWSLENFDKGSISQGRMWVYLPHHPRASKNGQILRAWVAYELYHGIILKNVDLIHHKNRLPLDDSKGNLERTNRIRHLKEHKCTKVQINCIQCGIEFKAKPSLIKRGGGKFCSCECGYKNRFERSTVLKICIVCGVEFRLAKQDASRRPAHTCSWKCRQELNSNRTQYL